MGKNRSKEKTPEMSKKKARMKKRHPRLEILKKGRMIHRMDSLTLYQIKTSRTETRG